MVEHTFRSIGAARYYLMYYILITALILIVSLEAAGLRLIHEFLGTGAYLVFCAGAFYCLLKIAKSIDDRERR